MAEDQKGRAAASIDLLEFYEAYGPGVNVRLPDGETVTCKPLTARQVAELLPLYIEMVEPKPPPEPPPGLEEEDDAPKPSLTLQRLRARQMLFDTVVKMTEQPRLLDLLPGELADLIVFFFYLSRPRTAKPSSKNGGGNETTAQTTTALPAVATATAPTA